MKNYIERQIEEKVRWTNRWINKSGAFFLIAFFSFLILAIRTTSPKWVNILFKQKDWIFHNNDFENIAWILIGLVISFGLVCIPAFKKLREVNELKEKLKKL